MESKITEYVDMFEKDGIVYLIYREKDLIDLGDAKKIVEDRLAFCDGTTYPHLFDIAKVKKITKDARDYFANEGNDLVSASALLINSAVERMIANFFITVNRPKNPTRLFNDEKQALKWLDQFRKKDKLKPGLSKKNLSDEM